MGFVTIAEAVSAKGGDIIFQCISLGELKAGNKKDGGTYQMQEATIKDNSSALSLQLWNDDIGKVMAGNYYFLSKAYWTEYKGKVQLSLGDYCELKDATAGDLLQAESQPTLDQSSSTAENPKGVDFGKLNDELGKITFAEKALKAFLAAVVDEKTLTAKDVSEQLGAVWNTAMMQKK